MISAAPRIPDVEANFANGSKVAFAFVSLISGFLRMQFHHGPRWSNSEEIRTNIERAKR